MRKYSLWGTDEQFQFRLISGATGQVRAEHYCLIHVWLKSATDRKFFAVHTEMDFLSTSHDDI